MYTTHRHQTATIYTTPYLFRIQTNQLNTERRSEDPSQQEQSLHEELDIYDCAKTIRTCSCTPYICTTTSGKRLIFRMDQQFLRNEHRQHLMKFDIPHVAMITTKQRTACIRVQANPVNETHTPPFTSMFHPSLLQQNMQLRIIKFHH